MTLATHYRQTRQLPDELHRFFFSNEALSPEQLDTSYIITIPASAVPRSYGHGRARELMVKPLELACILGDVDKLKQIWRQQYGTWQPAYIPYFHGLQDAIEYAATYGHLPIIQYFVHVLGRDTVVDNIEPQYDAFALAAENGHLPILKYFWRLLNLNGPITRLRNFFFGQSQADKKLIDNMIATNGFCALLYGVQYGDLDILNWLKQIVPDRVEKRIQDQDIFCIAAEYGQVPALDWLAAQLTVDPLSNDPNFVARILWQAAKGGHVSVLDWLREKKPMQFDALLTNLAREAFPLGSPSTYKGSTLCWLLNQLNPAVIGSMVRNSQALAVTENRAIFDWYIQGRLQALRDRIEAFSLSHPNSTFDFESEDSDEIQLYYHILYYQIRLEAPMATIDLLLSIPSIASLIAAPAATHQANECLKIAISLKNKAISQRLLQIPSVFRLAKTHRFYASVGDVFPNEEKQTQLLKEQINDRESVVRSKYQEREEDVLSKLKERYAKKVPTPGGTKAVLESLRQLLRERYQTTPAMLLLDDEKTVKSVALPCDFADLQKTGYLTKYPEKVYAAYAENPCHTALRYLSKPNHWMHPNAEYISTDPKNGDKWSCFEYYEELISYLFLAAGDESIGTIEGTSPADRLSLFIDQLALLGRAHNWNQSRIIENADGSVKYNKDGSPQVEEYDDKEADRPSCYSGTPGYLFHAVIHHPLLQELTQAKLMTELKTFTHDKIREKYQALPDETQDRIQNAWQALVLTGTATNSEYQALAYLNLSDDEISAFSAALGSKYPQSNYKAANFEIFLAVTQWFAIESPEETHVAKHFQSSYLSFINPTATSSTEPQEKEAPWDFARGAAAADLFGNSRRAARRLDDDEKEEKAARRLDDEKEQKNEVLQHGCGL